MSVISRDSILKGIEVKFPDMQNEHREWVADNLWRAYSADPRNTDSLFHGYIEAGVRSGSESAIQYAMACLKALII